MSSRTATTARERSESGGFLGTRAARFEDLTHFTIENTLLETTLGVVGNHAAPERNRDRVAQVLGDLPPSGKSIEDEFHGQATHAPAAEGARDEKFGHAVIDGRLARRRAAARHHGETDGLGATENDERIDGGITEPARELV